MAAGMGDMIMFIGAVAAASVMSGIVIDQGVDMTHALQARSDARVLALQTSFQIVNDPAATDDNPLTLHALNTGKLPIDPDLLVVLIDGATQPFSTAVAGGGDWTAGRMLVISVPGTRSVGDHVIELLGPHGAKDVFRYYEAGP